MDSRVIARWAEAPIKIARMTLTIKLDGNWNSFQLANNTPPLSVTGSVIAPSARMVAQGRVATGSSPPAWYCCVAWLRPCISFQCLICCVWVMPSLPLNPQAFDAGIRCKMLPRRVRCAWQSARPVQRVRASEQARENTAPKKNICDKQVSSWRHISCHTDKNRYYT